jgi:hypothetical protein
VTLDPGSRGERMLIASTLVLPLALGSLPGGRWLLPLLAPLALYPGFAARVRARSYYSAWKLAMAWAALLAAGVVLFVYLFPDAAARGVLHGEAYRKEMFGWIATGDGPENDWRQFLPQHLVHLGAFVLAAWASGGFLGLVMGAGLLDYMAYFVAAYARASGHPLGGLFAAWVPWSVLRVAAFVLLGVVLARPVLVRRAWPFASAERLLLVLALSGIVADLTMKTLLAPSYGLFLRQLVQGALSP